MAAFRLPRAFNEGTGVVGIVGRLVVATYRESSGDWTSSASERGELVENSCEQAFESLDTC